MMVLDISKEADKIVHRGVLSLLTSTERRDWAMDNITGDPEDGYCHEVIRDMHNEMGSILWVIFGTHYTASVSAYEE